MAARGDVTQDVNRTRGGRLVMKILLAPGAALLGLVLAGCGAGTKYNYPAPDASSFVQSCNQDLGSAAQQLPGDFCSCELRWLENHVSYSDFNGGLVSDSDLSAARRKCAGF